MAVIFKALYSFHIFRPIRGAGSFCIKACKANAILLFALKIVKMCMILVLFLPEKPVMF